VTVRFKQDYRDADGKLHEVGSEYSGPDEQGLVASGLASQVDSGHEGGYRRVPGIAAQPEAQADASVANKTGAGKPAERVNPNLNPHLPADAPENEVTQAKYDAKADERRELLDVEKTRYQADAADVYATGAGTPVTEVKDKPDPRTYILGEEPKDEDRWDDNGGAPKQD
jgi:hypothetical protein